MNLASRFLAATLAMAFCGSIAHAQTAPAPAKTATDASAAKPATDSAFPRAPFHCDSVTGSMERTFYLNNSVLQSDANELVTALRNMLEPCDKAYLVANQSAIVMEAPPDQLALAQKLITDLDRPRKTYRLTYTVTEVDSDKRIGTQHFAMVVVSGQETKLKQGSKIPLATGSYSGSGTTAAGGVQTQFTYLDVGMNFSAQLDEFANGVRLRSSVEQSSVGGQNTIAGVVEPVIRQTSLTGAAFLTPGKPLMLGSIDIPGSTRHLDVEVTMEQLP
jgi:type II secretory pathway component GspD/PulD (secretin)